MPSPSSRPGVSRGGVDSSARRAPGRSQRLVNICRLRVPLPETAWIARFSQLHPEIRIEVLSRLDVGWNRSLSEVRFLAPEGGPWTEELRALPKVYDVEELEGGPTALHLRITHRTSEFIPIFRELRLMRRFPFTIQAGESVWVVVATEAKIRSLLRRLREKAPAATMEAVHHIETPPPAGPLTPRQADLLRRAIGAGYFEVPRRITLTALAKEIGMAPSSLSEALAIVEKKLLERWYPGG